MSCRSYREIRMIDFYRRLAIESGLVLAEAENEEIKTSLQQWGIDYEDENLQLTKELAAKTFYQWLQIPPKQCFIQDKDDLNDPDAVMTLVSLGIMELNENNQFLPHQKINEKSMQDLIEHFILFINAGESEDYFDITLDEAIKIVRAKPYILDKNTGIAQFHPIDKIEQGQVVLWQEENFDVAYQVKSVQDGLAQLEAINPDWIQHIALSQSLEIDFEQAEFIIPEDTVVMNKNPSFSLLSASDQFKKEFQVQDFTVRLDYSKSNLSVYAFKKTSLDANFFVSLDIQNIQPQVKWKGSFSKIEHAYFKVNLDTTLSSGLKKGNYQVLYLDQSQFNPQDFITSLSKAWTNKKAQIDSVLPIAQIKVPIPQLPGSFLMFQIQLRLYFNGRVELTCFWDTEVGLEIRNNQLRFFENHKNDLDFQIQASTGITSGVSMGFHYLNLQLLDISFQAGIRALMKSTLHFPEAEQKIEIEDVPYDIIDTLIPKKEGFVVCADLSAHWVAQIILNSQKTLAGKIGLSKTFDILNQKNAPLFKGAIQHIENMQFVPKCTRLNKFRTPLPTIQTNLDRIVLGSYSHRIKQEESCYIKIRGLPQGVQLNQLKFSSSDDSIAQVDQRGKVTGIHKGNAIITITDGNHQVQCSILVKDK